MDSSAEKQESGTPPEAPFDEEGYRSVIGAITTLKERWKDADSEEAHGLWQTISGGSDLLRAGLSHEQHTDTTLNALLDLRIADPNDLINPVPDKKEGLVKDAVNLSDSLKDIPAIEASLDRTEDPKRLQLAMQVVTAATKKGKESIDEQKAFLLRHFEEGIRNEQREEAKDTRYTTTAQKMIHATPQYSDFGEVDDPQQRQEALAIFRRLIEDENTRDVGLYTLNNVYQFSYSMYGRFGAEGPKMLKAQIDKEILIPMLDVIPVDRPLFGFYNSTTDEIRKEIRMKKIAPLMESYGLNFSDLMSAWWQDGGLVKGGPKTRVITNDMVDIQQNVRMIQELEAEREGICKKLRKEFKIKNFSRYSKKVLIHMFDHVDDKNMKFGVAQVARYDNPLSETGGAFRNPMLLDNLLDQLQDEEKLGEKYGLRVYEFDGNDELAQNLDHAQENYGTTDSGEENKIQFIVVQAHGEVDRILTGVTRKGRKKNLTQRHFEHQVVKNFGNAFADKAPFVMGSCSTGVEGGFGSTMNAALNRKVIAPAIDTALRSITVLKREDGGIDLDAEYSDQGVKRVFPKAA